jgi:hypothetical protein
MGWFGRSIGDFGSQVGEGYKKNLDWRAKLQNMALQNARQKQSDLKNALDMQELQQHIKQMGQPQPAGIVKGPGGEESGVTFDPITSTYSAKTLIPGAPPEPRFKTPLEAMTYYANKGDAEKFNQFKAIYDATKPQKVTPGGYTDTQKDTQGRLWGFNKDTNKYEIIPTPGAKFRGENEKTPSEYDQRIANYLAANGMKDTPANRDKADQVIGVRNRLVPKPIPPDIQNLLSAPVPATPSAEQSRRLADAADRVFGGTAYKQDLMGRGRRSSFPIIGTLGRAPYASVAYDAKEYSDVLNSVREGATRGQVDFSDLGGQPVQPVQGQ